MEGKLILIIALSIVLYFLFQVISMKIIFEPVYTWWKNSGGNEYKSFMNLDLFISYYHNPIIYWFINNILTPPASRNTDASIRFITEVILPQKRVLDEVNNVQIGIIMPRHLCKSALLKREDNDKLFNDYLIESGKNEDVPLVYKSFSGPDNTTTFTVDKSKPLGVYPAPDDIIGWRGLVMEWCGDAWKMQTIESGPDMNYVNIIPANSSKTNLDEWFHNGVGRGDNFLARIGITPQSPLVQFFINQNYNKGDLEVDASALYHIIGDPGDANNAGGWLGFVQGISSSTVSSDKLRNFLYTDVQYQKSISANGRRKCSTGTKVFDGFVGGASSSVPLAMMAAGLGATTGGVGVAVGLLVSLGIGILSGVKAGKSCA